MDIQPFIQALPKAELHLHIEGSFEPELLFDISLRNGVPLKYHSVEELRAAYSFNNLQEFLDIYYAGANALLYEQDFYDLTMAYFRRVHLQNVVHSEIFFDPQTHTARGVAFETVITGIIKALSDAQKETGITSKLILCFLRHLDEADAFLTLEMALPWKQHIVGVGLDSSERGHPPAKFERVFAKARAEGFITVAHAGEEGPAAYVNEAIDLLNVSRIDHGNNAINDSQLIDRLRELQLPLTMCPLSNLMLKVQTDLSFHPLKRMMNDGILVTVNSDDPAYFGGYINENYAAIAEALGLSKQDIVQLAVNSFRGSFLSDSEKQLWINRILDLVAHWE